MKYDDYWPFKKNLKKENKQGRASCLMRGSSWESPEGENPWEKPPKRRVARIGIVFEWWKISMSVLLEIPAWCPITISLNETWRSSPQFWNRFPPEPWTIPESWKHAVMLPFDRALNCETLQPCGFWRCRSSRHDFVIAWAGMQISNTLRNRLFYFLPVGFRDNWWVWILEGAVPSSPCFDEAALPG